MFDTGGVLWCYTLTPTHMGAGQGLGYVDAPVARERVTNFPFLPGTGIKGALRHQTSALLATYDDNLPDLIFGPEVGAESRSGAGAVSFADASLIAFPVRSVVDAFVWVVSPTTLSRLERILAIANRPERDQLRQLHSSIRPEQDETVLVANEALVRQNDKVILDQFAFRAVPTEGLQRVGEIIVDGLKPIAPLIGTEDHERLQHSLVLVTDTVFGFFMESLLPVDPHVSIDPETGTAEEHKLFFVENVPAETVFAAPVLAGPPRLGPPDSRSSPPENGQAEHADISAADVESSDLLEFLTQVVGGDRGDGLGGLLQLGAKATSGSGLVGINLDIRESR